MSIRACAVVGLLMLVGCNGGGGGAVLLRVDAEMPGARCVNGGLAVRTGVDANGDGALGDEEVNAAQTKYVCNGVAGTPGERGDPGTAGLNALSVLTAEPPGANCRYGGTRVDVGLDGDGNGQLSNAEITSTRYLCDRTSVDAIFFGDLTLRNADDLALLDGVQVLAGSLFVESVPGDALTLPTLEVVAGQIRILEPSGGQGELPAPVRSVSFPALRRAGAIEGRFLSSLESISAPRLARLTWLDLIYDDALTTVALPELAVVDDVLVNSNPVLTALNLPLLKRAQSIEVRNNDLLAGLSMPLLREVANGLQFYGNPVLSACLAWRVLVNADGPGFRLANANDETQVCPAADVCRPARTLTGVSDPLRVCLRPLPFAEAQSTCAGLGNGAGLAWVTSDAEWLALSAEAALGGLQPAGWIGYSDAAVEGTWTAVSGFTGYSPTSRTDFWDPGEPSDSSGLENFSQLLANGRVNDADGALSLSFVCRAP